MIRYFFDSMLGNVIVVFACVFFALAGFALIRARKAGRTPNWLRILLVSLAIGYMAGLFGLTLEVPYLMQNGLELRLDDYNFVPFRQIIRVLGVLQYGHGSINFWGNIALFVPVGFAAPLLKRLRRPFIAGTLWTGVISVFIEILQMFTMRTTDIDDVILNTFGGLLGAALYVLFWKIFPKIDKMAKRPMLSKMA